MSRGGRNEAADRSIPVMLCADDYGLSRGIGEAIRTLIGAGRISAASCMTTGQLWPGEAALLRALADRVDVGLHLSLTQHAPVGPMPKLTGGAGFPSPGRLVTLALLGRVDSGEVAREIDRQIDRFADHMGKLPDFLDGHIHVHLLPGVREAVLEVFCRRLSKTGAWLRASSGRASDVFAHHGLAVGGAVWIGILGTGLRRLARAGGIPTCLAFRGIRRFFGDPPYAVLFEGFLKGLDPGGLIMCHPGLDLNEPLPTLHPAAAREEEYRFLMSDSFTRLLRAQGYRLARFAGCLSQAPGLHAPEDL